MGHEIENFCFKNFEKRNFLSFQNLANHCKNVISLSFSLQPETVNGVPGKHYEERGKNLADDLYEDGANRIR